MGEIFQIFESYINNEENKFEAFESLFEKLKANFNGRKFTFILIWDQINELFTNERKSSQETQFFLKITKSLKYFDFILLSASNRNEEIQTLENISLRLEMNPFEIFNPQDLFKLVHFEAEKYTPNDVTFLGRKAYSERLCDFLCYSITEYHFYKYSFFVSTDNSNLINKFSEATAQDHYVKMRRNVVIQSESEFRKKSIKFVNQIQEYYQCCRKIMTYEEFLNPSFPKVNK